MYCRHLTLKLHLEKIHDIQVFENIQVSNNPVNVISLNYDKKWFLLKDIWPFPKNINFDLGVIWVQTTLYSVSGITPT